LEENPMRDSTSFYLFTSISPRLGSNELEYQRSCVDSWRSAGFEVATVNGCTEVAEIAALQLGVQILSAGQNGKPRVRDILSCIVAKNCRYAGIINADCALLPYAEVSNRLKGYLDGRLVMAERIDVDALSMPQADSCGGFDAFFFDAATLPLDFSDSFRIGLPWWDYYFPMAVAAEGGRIANLMTPLLTHRIHSPGWIGSERERTGQDFWRFLKELRSSKPDSFPPLGHEVDMLWAEETLTIEQLGKVGSACFQWLRTRQFENHLGFLPARMEPIEALLRSMRMVLKKSAEREAEVAHVRTQLEAEVARLRTEVGERTAEVLNLREQSGSLRTQLTAVEQSTSWRITKPLRQVSSVLRAGTTSRA
jgi:hypothetical protein